MLRRVKLTIFLYLVCLSNVSCGQNTSSKPQETDPVGLFNKWDYKEKVSLDTANMSFEAIIKEISKQTGKKIVISNDDPQLKNVQEKKVDIKYENTPFWEAIAMLSLKSGVGFQFPRDSIIFDSTMIPVSNYKLVGPALLAFYDNVPLKDGERGIALACYSLEQTLESLVLPQEVKVAFINGDMATAKEVGSNNGLSYINVLYNFQKKTKYRVAWVEGEFQFPFEFNKIKLCVDVAKDQEYSSNEITVIIKDVSYDKAKGILSIEHLLKWNTGLTENESKRFHNLIQEVMMGKGHLPDEENKWLTETSKKAKIIKTLKITLETPKQQTLEANTRKERQVDITTGVLAKETFSLPERNAPIKLNVWTVEIKPINVKFNFKASM